MMSGFNTLYGSDLGTQPWGSISNLTEKLGWSELVITTAKDYYENTLGISSDYVDNYLEPYLESDYRHVCRPTGLFHAVRCTDCHVSTWTSSMPLREPSVWPQAVRKLWLEAIFKYSNPCLIAAMHNSTLILLYVWRNCDCTLRRRLINFSQGDGYFQDIFWLPGDLSQQWRPIDYSHV